MDNGTTIATAVTAAVSNITKVVVATASTLTTTLSDNSTVATTETVTTTVTSATPTATIVSSSSYSPTALPVPSTGSSPALLFFSIAIFIAGVAVVVKIIISNRNKRSDLIGGTARWRLAASQQSGSTNRTAASYAPMDSRPSGGLDSAGPDRTLDWERQFFDDNEPAEPSRLQLNIRQP